MSEKSVVTCDLEGRIETFNVGAEALFGWRADEVVGKRRVSLFSPGRVVLTQVGGWLEAARRDGELRTRTAFLRRDGAPFAAEIEIRPTFREGRQIGYCGVTVPLADVDPASVMPKTGVKGELLRWVVVTRAPFLTATLVPVLIGAALVAARPFPWAMFALVALGAVLLHVAANTFNDYFDWKSGTDQANADYLQPFSGGSRAIELGLISERGLLSLAVGSLALAAAVGVALLWLRGPGILAFGLAGAFAAYFYTAPPLRLAARGGLGELLVCVSFGPLVVAGTIYALSGSCVVFDFVAGLPIGLLTTAILWVNEIPDASADAKTGKRNLVVVLGERARWGYVAVVAAAFAALVVGVATGATPRGALVALGALPLAVWAGYLVVRYHADRALIRGCAATINLHLATGVLMAVGLLLTR